MKFSSRTLFYLHIFVSTHSKSFCHFKRFVLVHKQMAHLTVLTYRGTVTPLRGYRELIQVNLTIELLIILYQRLRQKN